MPIVSLKEVIDALDLQSDELTSYLDPETGEIITFNEEEAGIARSGEWERQPEWMRESLPKIKRALEDDRMIELPDRAHIDEWRMMRDFAEAQDSRKATSELLDAIQGSGAFRSFKRAIERLDLEQAWYKYRETAFERVARNWLAEHKLAYQ